VTFAIYKEQEGGAALWLETQNVELDEAGRYTVLLGATKSAGLPLELFLGGETRWLGAQVQLPGEVEQRRVLLVSVPYALKAADAETLGGKPASVYVTTEQGAVAGTTVKGKASASTGTGLISPALSGTGSTNVVAKWLDNMGALGNSQITDDGTNVNLTGSLGALAYKFTGNAAAPTDATATILNQANVGPVFSGLSFKVRTGAPVPGDALAVDAKHNASITGNASALAYKFTGNAAAPTDATATIFNQANVGPVFSGLSFKVRTGASAPADALSVDPSQNVSIVAGNLNLSGSAKAIVFPDGTMRGSTASINGTLSVSGDIKITGAGNGVVVRSPDGTRCRQIGIDNTGSRVITAVPCPNQPRCVYVANQLSNNVSAYTVDPATGKLGAVAGSPFTVAGGPTSVAADPSGQFLYAANSVGGNSDWVSAFVINASTCAQTEVPGSPFPPPSFNLTILFPLAVAVHPSGGFLYLTSLTGAVACFTIDRLTGALSQCSNPPAPAGTFTNSIALHPSGRFAYVTNQASGNVSGYSIDSTGNLTPISGSPFPVDCRLAGSCSPLAVAMDPLKKFAYVANSDTTISSYNIEGTMGKLTFTPKSPFVESNPSAGGFSWVAVHTSGNFVLATGTGGFVAVCRIDRTTGDCTEIPGSPFVAGTDPSSIAVDPTGRFVYVTDQTSSSISAYTIDPITGVLISIDCGQCQTGAQAVSIVVTAPAP
jgi:6-phosphogluconolactonase (cycloisomerase 2 family)